MPAPHDARPVEQRSDRTELRLRARVGEREEFAFATADGVRSPGTFPPSELRLLDVLAERPPESLLVPEANYGVLGVVMAEFADDVTMIERSARAARLCRENARRNRVDSGTSVAIVADPRRPPGNFDAAALAPAEYEPCAVVQQRLVDTLAALNPGGELYLAAREDAGGQRYRRTLRSHCRKTTTLDDRDDLLVVRGVRPEGFDPTRYAELRTLRPTIDGTTLTLVSYPGLFSASEIDDGTRVLAEGLEIGDGERVLDLACGYGPLGMYAAETADCAVTLTDDDRMATVCARESAAASGLSPAAIETADGVAAVRDREFDRVVCNPPTHSGSGGLHDLLRGASEVLARDGEVNLVHHAGIDFDRYLEPYFDRVDGIDSGDYRIVTATRPS